MLLKHNSSTKSATQCTVLLLPTAAWATLAETLDLDSRSSAFDPALRQKIQTALDQVQPVTAQVGALLDVAEEVPRCGHLTTGAGQAYVIGEDRLNRLNRTLSFFRSPFKLCGGRRHYRKRLV